MSLYRQITSISFKVVQLSSVLLNKLNSDYDRKTEHLPIL